MIVSLLHDSSLALQTPSGASVCGTSRGGHVGVARAAAHDRHRRAEETGPRRRPAAVPPQGTAGPDRGADSAATECRPGAVGPLKRPTGRVAREEKMDREADPMRGTPSRLDRTIPVRAGSQPGRRPSPCGPGTGPSRGKGGRRRSPSRRRAGGTARPGAGPAVGGDSGRPARRAVGIASHPGSDRTPAAPAIAPRLLSAGRFEFTRKISRKPRHSSLRGASGSYRRVSAFRVTAQRRVQALRWTAQRGTTVLRATAQREAEAFRTAARQRAEALSAAAQRGTTSLPASRGGRPSQDE